MRITGRGVAILLATLLALALAGCERRSQDPPAAGAPAARMLATADLGREVLMDVRVPPDQSVMRALRGATDVETAHGGAFVSSMLGRRSDLAARRDWFFYRNGVLADVGASGVRIADGDTVWWDHRFWGGMMDVWAVVGLWPRPFAADGEPPGPVAADPPLATALRAAGAEVTAGAAPWRVRVGAHADLLRREPAWRRASADPTGAGLTAAVEDGRITALDAEGRRREPVAGARALVAAMPTGSVPADGVLMAVVGLDAAAARAAAERIAREPEVLAGRFALTFDGAGEPVRAAGREGP